MDTLELMVGIPVIDKHVCYMSKNILMDFATASLE